MVLAIRNLSVKNIVKNVSFEVKGNVVLLGHNGAGKSTIAKAIMGFIKYRGNILLNGESIDDLKPYERAKKGIAYVMQNPPELEHISVKRLFYICNTDDEYIKKLLNMFNLSESILSKKLSYKEISGGERKKIELICALLSNPKVMILDEVDAGLDAFSKKIMLRFIENKNALIITHDTNFAKQVNAKILLMKNGELIKQGGKEVVNAYENA